MKKTPVTEQSKPTDPSTPARSTSSSRADLRQAEGSEPEDPMAGLQADLDRFRDLALRSQADFENYKKRAAREKEEAIKYANRAWSRSCERGRRTVCNLFRNDARSKTT